MRWNVVEIARNGLYVRLYRGFLIVMKGDTELGRAVLDEINCLLLTAEQATLSKPVMVRLAEEGVAIVICGHNYHPLALCLPYGTHYQGKSILQLQIDASRPLNKRLWQRLVKAKIDAQLNVLSKHRLLEGGATTQLRRLMQKVKSGDPENIEAQAARIYWQALFGSRFRRRSNGMDAYNRALNYGYSIVRAACARALVAAGLNPSLGLHHHNAGNPYCLADDIMEIYRPLVDAAVLKFISGDNEVLCPDQKAQLARVLQRDVRQTGQLTAVASSMQTLANSLVQSYRDKKTSWQLPDFMWSAHETSNTTTDDTPATGDPCDDPSCSRHDS